MSLDLLDRLIADIYAVTESLMKSDSVASKGIQPSASHNVEKQLGSKGVDHIERSERGDRPMEEGVHRTVC